MIEKSIKSKALTGSAWTMAGYGASQFLRLGGNLILAWLLSPAIFGLMALVRVFKAGLEMFSDIGIGPSIIQNKRGQEPAFQNTAWTIQIIRGFGLWVVTCILAWPFTWLYAQNDPDAWQLLYLLPVTAVTAIFAGFNSTSLFILNKEVQLGRLTMLELGVQVVSLTVMVGWALLNPTPWAMVAGGLVAAFVKMLCSHFLLPGHRVSLGWDRACSRELFRFGKWIFLSTAFTFLAANLDKLLLGNILTLSDLGVYSIALIFAGVAMEVARRLGSTVMFPVYAKFQNQPTKLMDVALRSREVVLWAGLAVCISFSVGAPLFFETLWDPRYHQAGAISQWLAVLIWTRVLLITMDRIPLALGNARVLFFSNVIQTSFIVLAITGYWVAGLPGFILGLSIGPLASHLFLLCYVPNRKGEMLRQSLRFTLMAGIAGGGLVVFSLWVRENYGTHVWFFAVISGTVIPVLIAAWIIYKQILGNDLR
ncbi:oligosaccharide flippase family protein [Desulfurivibrio sp. D14AmB]|uniref:oligosaccharide flippase family protein n=1 Tax=Desulfurivibrio sp. D14AmB TaxID=3374370 RepID=UPI00376EE12C